MVEAAGIEVGYSKLSANEQHARIGRHLARASRSEQTDDVATSSDLPLKVFSGRRRFVDPPIAHQHEEHTTRYDREMIHREFDPRKETFMPRLGLVTAIFGVLVLALPVLAQDPVKVDPKHYKVEFENDQVRVLRVQYGPHEKSVMHHHPDTFAVFLTDGHAVFHLQDGKTIDAPIKAGTTQWSGATMHDPENVGDSPFELLVIEMKHGAGAAKNKSK